MSVRPEQLGAYRAGPATTARMASVRPPGTMPPPTTRAPPGTTVPPGTMAPPGTRPHTSTLATNPTTSSLEPCAARIPGLPRPLWLPLLAPGGTAPRPPPEVTRVGGRPAVGGLSELQKEIVMERKKRGRAEHEYKEMKKRLAQEKSARCKVEVTLAEMKKHVAKVEKKLRELELEKLESMAAVVESSGEDEEEEEKSDEEEEKSDEEDFEADELFDTPGLMSQHEKAAMDFKVAKPCFPSILNTKELEGSHSSSPYSTPSFVGCRSSLVTVTSRLATSPTGASSAASSAALFPSTPSKLHPSRSTLAVVSPSTSYSPSINQLADNLATFAKVSPSTSSNFISTLSSSKTTGAKFKFKKKLSFSTNDPKENYVEKEDPVENAQEEKEDPEEDDVEENEIARDEYFKEEYKDTLDHIEIIKKLPKREEEVFKAVKGRLSAASNYKFLALLYSGLSGEETVAAFQLTRKTFKERYGEEFEAAEAVAAAGPTGGKGKDKVRDAVLKVKSATWVRGITWIFNSLAQFVKAKSEFR